MPTDDYVDPRRPDPRFPDRPTHPDFFIMSDVTQDHDFQSERLGRSPMGIIGVDEESFHYFLQSRLAITAQRTGLDLTNPALKALLGAIYMDAFATGKAFQKEKEKRANG